MRNILIAVIAILLTSYVLADTYTSASVVAIQDHPYDLQEVLDINSTSAGATIQDTPYDMQTVSDTVRVSDQDTQYDMQTVVNTVVVFDQNATVPKVDYHATYDPNTNKTTVSITITSDPVPTYYVFVYDTSGNLLTSYATSNANSSTTIQGQYSDLYIVVIANSIGIAGYLDLGIYPAFVVGTNIVPIKVDSIGKYNIDVYGGYAISPVYVADTNQPVYVIATAKMVKVIVSS